MANEKRRVEIPAMAQHEGFHSIIVELDWVCPQCGGPRGEVVRSVSYDGSRRLGVDGWLNPCGHVDYYSDVRKEAAAQRQQAEEASKSCSNQ